MRYWLLPGVSAVLLVVLPPDVAGGDVHVTSDPCVFVVRCFTRRLWLTIYIWGRVSRLFYCYFGLSLLFSLCCHFRSSLPGPPLSVYPRSQVAQPWKLGSLPPASCTVVPGSLLYTLSRSVRAEHFDYCSTVRFSRPFFLGPRRLHVYMLGACSVTVSGEFCGPRGSFPPRPL